MLPDKRWTEGQSVRHTEYKKHLSVWSYRNYKKTLLRWPFTVSYKMYYVIYQKWVISGLPNKTVISYTGLTSCAN